MRLLFVHQHLGEWGGAEANIHLVADQLQRRGHTLGLLYRLQTGRNEDEWGRPFSERFSLPTQGNAEQVEAALDQFAPEVVFLHNLPDTEVLAALLASPAPVVRLVHDHSLYCLRHYKYNYFTRRICTRPASGYCVFPCLGSVGRSRDGGWPFRWLSYRERQSEIRLTRRCAALVVYSQYMREELVRNGFAPERVEVCEPLRRPNNHGMVSSFSQRNLVLYAGQILRGKGVDALLRALARVPVPFECAILGEGHHRAYCERLCARLGLASRVRFYGFLLPAESKALYLEASVFVMSSLWPEPFGLAGPEAMAYGLPVVAFDAGAIREWLRDGETGYLVPWNDTRRFAARLTELLANKDLARQMGQRGLEQVQAANASGPIDHLEEVFRRVHHLAPIRPDSPCVRANPICL